MYKIYADDTLIYDSTIEDFKIGKGQISLEVNKSGSFVFSVYPDHFYYDNFVKLKTVILVRKDNKIVFRGRILNDVTDYWNNKVITCEGELGFLQDSIIRPFNFTGTPEDLFKKFVNEHNAQVDEFKRFKIGSVTVVDPNNYINRSNTGYESALSNLNSRLIEDSLGGYFYVTHENNEELPTLNYLADFTNMATQYIEFGSNLKDYTKTANAEEIATAIIPLGATVDDGDDETEDPKLTIKSVNNGVDYVYDETAVGLRGWIFKTVEWDDVTDPNNLKSKAEAYLRDSINQNITIELNAIDLHLLDKSIESFNVCDYIRVISIPHNFDDTLLCSKQTIDLLKPENDTIILGYTYASFTETSSKTNNNLLGVTKLQSSVSGLNYKVNSLNGQVNEVNNNLGNYATVEYLKQYVAENGGTGAGGVIEGLSKTLLWTNPSPTSEFATQRISLPLSEYDEIEIEVAYRTVNLSRLGVYKFSLKEYIASFIEFTEASQFAYMEHYSRGFSLTESSIVFADAYHKGTHVNTAGTVDNNFVIPIAIYGIKIKSIATGIEISNEFVEALKNDVVPIKLGGTGGKTANDAIKNLGVADYVVEQYVSGQWTVVKWNSGRMEVSGKQSLTATGTNTVVTVSMPVSFVNTDYVVNATPAHNGSVVTKYGDYNASGNVSHGYNNFYFGFSVSSVYSIYFNFIIIGRWK